MTNWPFLGWLLPLSQTAEHLHENVFRLQAHFHMKGFVLGLVLKQRQKVTWKWPIQHELI